MSRKDDCCKDLKNACCKKSAGGSGRPGPSGIPGQTRSNPGPSRGQGLRPPSTSRLVPPSSSSRLAPPGQSRLAPPGTSRLAPTGSRLAPPSSRTGPNMVPSGAPSQRLSAPSTRIASSRTGVPSAQTTVTKKTVIAAISRPPMAGLSKTVSAEITKPHPKGGTGTARVVSKTLITGPSASNVRKGIAVSMTQVGRSASEKSTKIGKPTAGKSSIPPPKKPSRLQRFDQTASAELSRRKNAPTTATAATSDINLLGAVDALAKAEAAHSFAGAVAAAEAAAASAPNPRAAEEAAAHGARSFQAEIVDVVQEDVPGVKPIQILGYVGITRPTYAAK